MNHTLLLASKSPSRQRLLKEADIKYQIIEQDADETNFDLNLPLQTLVENIAAHKMDHVILPVGKNDGEVCFVLTADTLGLNFENKICRKPETKADAIQMIKSYRKGAQTGTAFCLDKKIWKNGKWEVEKRIIEFVSSKYIFDVPDDWIEKYFEGLIKISKIDYMKVSGAVAVEEYGNQFLKLINGSYSTIVGLPMYELRQALETLNFFE